MSKYKVVGDESVTLEGVETPVEVGQEVELDEAVAAPLVEAGKLEVVPADDSEEESDEDTEEEDDSEEEEESSEEESSDEAAVDQGPTLVFNGKKVITDTTRTVEGKEYHHFVLEDGTSQDVTDEEYEAVVDASTK